MMVNIIKYSRSGEAGNPLEKATKAMVMDMISKSTPRIIFFSKEELLLSGI